jgi:uncharacterized damage-inducible protein DinB
MGSQQKEILIVDTGLSAEPEIGLWLWALQETRERTMRELGGLFPAMIDWLPPSNGSSIGTVLYPLAGIEADWLYAEVLEQEIPPDVMELFPHPTRDAQGRLTQVPGYSLEQHIRRLETVRSLLMETFRSMALADFRRKRSLDHYDVTPEWVLHHLIQHEAEHRGQIGALRAAAEHALAA